MNRDPEYDVVVVGAGFAGMYLLHLLRGHGFRTVVLEAAPDVGGTWYWNRYPGARCDVRSIDYSYSFDADLEQEWDWSEKYATQAEILRYARHVADRFDLRADIRFDTRVKGAVYDEGTGCWAVTTEEGDKLSAQFYVMATGCLSASKMPELPGIDDFIGDSYHTSRWPHEPVDFGGMRVGVIGTGSSAIQSIPLIAEQADHLTVFQRTPNFSVPASNGPNDPDEVAEIKAMYPDYRHRNRVSFVGVPLELPTVSALDVTDEERHATFESGWRQGGIFALSALYLDLRIDPVANGKVAEFVRNKIRAVVDDAEVAERLCPTDYPFGTKRLCVDSHYFETYNRDSVRLVDIRKQPITSITRQGLDTVDESFVFDAIVYATGFDAMTGAVVAVDIEGNDGLTIREKWADGPRTYLGLLVAGFPNFFTITGPGSPSVLSNMIVSIEQHVEWITDCLLHLRRHDLRTIETTVEAEGDWVRHVNDLASETLYPKANSWYMGANVPGKTRVFLPYIGGVGPYRQICDDVAAAGYRGCTLGS